MMKSNFPVGRMACLIGNPPRTLASWAVSFLQKPLRYGATVIPSNRINNLAHNTWCNLTQNCVEPHKIRAGSHKIRAGSHKIHAGSHKIRADSHKISTTAKQSYWLGSWLGVARGPPGVDACQV